MDEHLKKMEYLFINFAAGETKQQVTKQQRKSILFVYLF